MIGRVIYAFVATSAFMIFCSLQLSAQTEFNDIFDGPGRLGVSAEISFPKKRAEEGVLTDALVANALQQAPASPVGGFESLGQELEVRSRNYHAHPSPLTPFRCDPSTDKCIEYLYQETVRPMQGDQGWCNPPFVNFATQATAIVGPSGSGTLIEAQGKNAVELFTIPGPLRRNYTANAVAIACPGAYIAVVDTYWTGFVYPLHRAVMHLAVTDVDRNTYPECWANQRVIDDCYQRVFDGFGRPNPPNKFADLRQLYSSRPSAAEIEENLASLAPPLTGNETVVRPTIASFDEPDRNGVIYTGWEGEWLEIGCSTGNFGVLTGRPYLMISAPLSQVNARGTVLRFVADPAASGYWARVWIKGPRGSIQRGSPQLPLADGAVIQDGDQEKFALALDLSDHVVQRYLTERLSEVSSFEGFSVTAFPPNGDGIMGVEVDPEFTSSALLRSALETRLGGC